MGRFGSLFGWVTGHEQLLSGLAALVVIAGVVISPLGHGLRALLARQRERPAPDGAPPLTPPPPIGEGRPSVAVLPFTNMSDDREQEFLADGMTEDIITGLSLTRLLFVIARNSSFVYKGKAVNVRDVGRELGVRTVLEGSVRRMGESLRVTAQLIDTRTGSHLWAQAFDRPVADIFKMQDEITAGIVAALTAHLTRTVTPEVARARPENLEAWELCLRARANFVAHTNAEGRRVSEGLLRAAVKKDPNYAVAWVLLGSIIAFRWHVEPGRDAAADLAEARACVERGSGLAPNDPDVLAFHGHFLMTSGRPKDALPFLQQAMRLNPNAVLNRVGLAQALCYTGRAAEAVEVMDEVLRLSPRDPSAPSFAHNIAFFHFALGQFVESEMWVRRALAGSANNVLALLLLAEALAGQDRIDEARDALREALKVAPETTLASQEYILRNLGLDEALVAAEVKYLTLAWPPELT